MELEVQKLRRNLQNILREHGLNYNSWAKRASVSEGLIRHFITGESDNLSFVKLVALAKAVGLSVEELISGDRANQSIGYIPICGKVPGNELKIENTQNHSDMIYWHKADPNLFAVTVYGNSMNRIAPDGAVIVVDTTFTDPLALVGSYVIARYHQEYIFRILKANPTRFEANSTDSGFEAIFPQSGQSWQIMGKVIQAIKKINE